MKCIFLSFLVFLSLVFPAAGAQSFSDTGIVLSMKTALSKNPLVLEARDLVLAAGRDLSSDEFRRLPTLSFVGETEGNRESEALIRALQPLWVGGRIDNAVLRSQIGLDIYRTELHRVQRNIMEDTAVAYADLLGLDARISAADKNIDEHQRLLELISRRKEGRVSSEADVELARSRLSQARLLREELRGRKLTVLATLEALTLTPAPDPVPVPEDLIKLPAPEAVEALAVKNSMVIAGAKLGIEQGKIEKALTKSEMMPKVYARLDQELYNRTSLSDQDLDTRLGLVVEGSWEGAGFPLYEKVKAVEERIRSAKMAADAKENSLRRDIRAILAEREMSGELVRLNQALVTTTQSTLESYMRQYEAGRKSWLDLLYVQQEFARARLDLEQVKSTFLQDCLRLSVRTGQLDAIVETEPIIKTAP